MLFLTLYLEIVYHLWLGRYGSRSTDELVGESGSQFPALIWKLSLPHRSRFVPGVPIAGRHETLLPNLKRKSRNSTTYPQSVACFLIHLENVSRVLEEAQEPARHSCRQFQDFTKWT